MKLACHSRKIIHHWDEALDEPFKTQWETFVSDLKKVRELSIERCYSKD